MATVPRKCGVEALRKSFLDRRGSILGIGVTVVIVQFQICLMLGVS
jgi:hypothetical protein